MSSTAEQASELRDQLRVIRTHKWQIVLITLLVTGTALFGAFRRTPIYEARSEVLVRPIVNPNSSGLALPQPLNLDTERLVVLSQTVAAKVRAAAGPSISLTELLGNVRVEVAGNSEVLAVSYDSPVPATAARLANAFAAAYVDYRTEQILDQYTAAAAAVQKRVNNVRDQLAALASKGGNATASPAERDTLVAQLTVLTQRLLDLQANQSTVEAAGQIIQRAEIPTTPVSPNKARDGALALFAGLLLGLGVVFVRERLDDRVKGLEELEKQLGVPVIAAVPRAGDWRRREEAKLILLSEPRSPISESYRTLATGVQYSASQRPLKVLMVTSSMGGEGKSTTASNLAVALAQAGKRVILVSADLRRSRIHQFFNVSNDVGMVELLAGDARLAEGAKSVGVPNLRVVVGGRVPDNPAALLGSPGLLNLIADMRECSDFVVIDTPPVLAVADASILAPIVDGTIFIVDGGRAGRSAMQRSWSQLGAAGARVIGAVYNNFDPGESTGYPYYYSRYYRQYYGPANGSSSNGHTRKPWRPWAKKPASHNGSQSRGAAVPAAGRTPVGPTGERDSVVWR